MGTPKLFLLHFAGGNCYSYRFLQPYLDGCDFIPLELPGRGKRLHEKLLRDFDQAAEDLYRQIKVAAGESSFLIYGHSLGAVLAIKVASMVEQTGLNLTYIIVSGNPGPGIRDDCKKYNLERPAFRAAVKRLGGMSADSSWHEELFNFYEPILRADFKLAEEYPSWLLPPVKSPIYALMGRQEQFSEQISNWRNFTLSDFNYEILDGGHFFVYKQAGRVAEVIRKCLSVWILILSFFWSGAQSLYKPLSVEHAFRKGTRSADGRPGEKYWQNTARYDISVVVMPPDRIIKGDETISYFNRSPDTLKNIIIKLTQNIHRAGALRDDDAEPNYLSSGIFIDSFSVNGEVRQWKDNSFNHTMQVFDLNKPLAPGDSTALFFQWHYRIALQSGREGMIDSTTYFLAYFYPRISVYDDYDGWDHANFNDVQEFYNDFNDFRLRVKVPENYIVWSTGTLQNAKDVLRYEYAQRLASSMNSDSMIHIITKNDLSRKNITSPGKNNIWEWKAGNIMDIAFAVGDHFLWDGSSLVVDSNTRRRVSVQAAYNDTAADFHLATEYGRYALGWLSEQWPGIPYPYTAMTIFQGYADMEYPMMINTENTSWPAFSRFLIDHEIAHSWFPFYMGIDESRYAFMDEGWVSFFELLIGRTEGQGWDSDEHFRQWRVYQWIFDPSPEGNLPIMTPAIVLRNPVYSYNAYGKPALAYLALKDLLGDTLFKKCLHAFMSRWQGKHPIPWDFFNTYNAVAGKDLDWFWSNWFFSSYYIDLSLQAGVPTGTGFSFTIGNTGKLAVPFDLQIEYTDGSKEIVHKTPAIWMSGVNQAIVNLTSRKKVSSATLVTGVFVDANKWDNTWTPTPKK